jgi:CoA:oxalate CoA-transferase
MILADLGAEVIKIEPPGRGDDARHFGPLVNGESAYFRLLNRNKLSVTLDLKDPTDRERFVGLVERADVLVENFRPGTLDRLGLAVPRLLHHNPRLVAVSISGFGQTGSLANRPAYDILVQAMSGLMAATGPEGGGPTRSAVSLGDLVPGLYAVIAILAALRWRTLTGRGQWVDLAMLDALLSILESVGMRALHTDEPIVPLGNDHAVSAPYGTYACADGEIVIAVANEPLFARLAAALGHPEWTADPRFARDDLRARHRHALRQEMEAVLATMSTEEALGLLVNAGIPAGPVLGVRQALAGPAAQERGMVATEEDGFRTLGTPLRLAGVPAGLRPAPALGAHNDRLADWLAEPPRTALQGEPG